MSWPAFATLFVGSWLVTFVFLILLPWVTTRRDRQRRERGRR